MRSMISAVSYLLRSYVRTSRPLMPFLTLLLLTGLLYGTKPVQAADSYTVSTTILCFASTWIGLTYCEVQSPVSEQLLVLKLGGIVRYQLAYTLSLMVVGLCAALLCTLLPLLLHVVNGFTLYDPPVNLPTVLFSVLLHFCAAFMGTATGAFFHPRYVPERKNALLFICFVLVVAFVKVGLHDRLPFARGITWLFPPIAELSESLAGTSSFPPDAVLLRSAHFLLYGGVLTALRLALLRRLRFS